MGRAPTRGPLDRCRICGYAIANRPGAKIGLPRSESDPGLCHGCDIQLGDTCGAMG